VLYSINNIVAKPLFFERMAREYNFKYIRNPETSCNKLWYTDRQHAVIMDYESSTSVIGKHEEKFERLNTPEERFIEVIMHYETPTSVIGRHEVIFDILNTPQQRVVEGQLFLQAIQDLYNYVLHANHNRKFIISIMKIGNESSKFGCWYKNGSWSLTYIAKCEVDAVRKKIRYPFEFWCLVDLADHIDVVGIAFIEAIPHVVPM